MTVRLSLFLAAVVLGVQAACGSTSGPAQRPTTKVCGSLAVAPHQVRLKEANQPIPGFALDPETKPVGIALDRDGSSVWVLGTGLNRVVHVGPDGAATEYDLPPSELGLQLAQDASGTVWVPEQDRAAVAAIAADGSVRECKLPTGSSQPAATAIGADGSVWISAGSAVDRFAGGRMVAYPIGVSGATAAEVLADPVGGAWFTLNGSPNLGRISAAGAVTRIPIGGSGTNLGLMAAPDGAVWVADFGADRVVHVASDGAVTAFAAAAGAKPQSFGLGPGGVVWVTESGIDRIGRVRDGGVEAAIPTGQWPDHMAVTPDGWAWFTEYYGDRLGRVRLPAA